MGTRSVPRTIQFIGAWQTHYGEMRLTQTGQRITGCYGHSGTEAGDKLVEGTLEGPIFFTCKEPAAQQGLQPDAVREARGQREEVADGQGHSGQAAPDAANRRVEVVRKE